MKIAIINLIGRGMSEGYRKYLRNVLPRMASNPAVEAVLCALPQSLNMQDWFKPIFNITFVTCRPFRPLRRNSDSQLHMHLERFSPDVVFVPVERSSRFSEIPVVNMIQNMEPLVSNINGNPFNKSLKQWIQYVDGKRAIKKADRRIALSRFISDFLLTHWSIPNEKIGIVHHEIVR